MALLVSHSTQAYEIGGGIVTAAFWDGVTPPEEADYFDMGNCPAFGYTVDVVNVEHKSSRGGQLVVDKKIVKEVGYKISFTLDEPTSVNKSIFLKGTISGNYIYALEDPNMELAIRFTSDMDAGENKVVDFWRVSIAPSGDFQEISFDNFKDMKFEATGLSDVENHPTNQWFRETKIELTV